LMRDSRVDSYETGNGSGEPTRNNVPDDLAQVINFSDYDLCTTLRLITLSGESREVSIRRGANQGTIYIADGEIRAAATRDLAGDEALFQILSWDAASHVDAHHAAPAERNIRVSTPVLLEILKKEVFQPT